jgi:hypothetical protein
LRIVLIIATVIAAMSFDLRPAPAAGRHWYRPVAPWCAVYSIGWGDTQWDCSYPSLESCRPFVIAGTRGFCNPNPAYTDRVEPEHRKHRYR